MDGTILGKKYNLMNGNSGGGANSASIAPTFSETSQYIYGDLVFYEGQLYRFEVEEHEPGPWNPEEVMGTSIDENLVMLPGNGLQRTMHEFSVKLKSDGGLHFDQNGAIYADHLPDYRLTEHKTGQQWIDGSDIYFKVVNFGALPNNTYKDVSSGLTNVKILEIKSFCDDGANFLTIPRSAIDNNYAIELSYNYSLNVVRIATSVDMTSYSAYAVLYYTKPTQTSKKKTSK